MTTIEAVARTSARLMLLLSLLATGRSWSRSDLADRLEVGERTVRRDLDTLRELGYAVLSSPGPGGGYRLGTGPRLPPLLFDDDQALAIAVALQTAPATVFGLGEQAERALVTLRQVMPVELRAVMDALPFTRLLNYWEFSAPPIEPAALKPVGRAVARRESLTVEVVRADGSRPQPRDPDFAPRTVEPHHLVVWAGRWYVIAWDPVVPDWVVLRVDRIRVGSGGGRGFTGRPLPDGGVGRLVTTRPDRGDVVADWQCTGAATMDLPAETVARWAPGGSLVERLDDERARITIGAWSWAGIAGILATFDTALSDVEPPELVDACRRLAERWLAI